MATYTYSLSADFGNQICVATLTDEILAEGAITTVLTDITVGPSTNADSVDIVFISALGGGEVTALNGVVAAHDGSVCPEPDPIPYMPIDGSLAFTNPVSGVDPTMGSHLATQTITEESSGNALVQSMEYTDTLVAATSGGVGALLGLGEWKYDTSTTPPPTDKQFSFNNASLESSTKFYIDYTNQNGDDLSNILSNVAEDNTILYFQQRKDANKAFWVQSNAFADQTTYGEFDIENAEDFGNSIDTNKNYSLIVGNIGGVSTFLGLTDTPSVYTDEGGQFLAVKGAEDGVEFVDAPSGTGSGDVTAASSIGDEQVVRGDGGAKGVQGSNWTISDGGVLSGGGDLSGYILDMINRKTDGGGYGFRILAGELAGDIAFHIADADDTFQIMEMEADQGYITLGKTVAQTIIDNGLAYCIDNQHDASPESDFNTQIGTYRIAGVDIVMPAGGTTGQVLAKVNATDYNTEWVDEGAGGGVFGSDYNYESSEGTSSTTSTTWQNKLDFDVDVAAGTYMLQWYAEVRSENTSTSVQAQVEVTGGSVVASIDIEPQDTDNYYPFGGMVEVDLDGVHDIDMDFRRFGSFDTVYIRRARLTVWRVS